MDYDQLKRRAWFSGSLIALLGILGLVMAVLQYRWTGELSRAEQERISEALQRSLFRLSFDLENEISTRIQALQPSRAEIAENGREVAYAERFVQSTEPKLFRAAGLAIPENGQLSFKLLDDGSFSSAAWPENWTNIREQLNSRMRGERVPMSRGPHLLVEMPRFAKGGEQEWLVLQLDSDYIRDVLLPRQIARHLPPGAGELYRVEVYARDSKTPVYRAGLSTGESLRDSHQASVSLLDLSRAAMVRGPGGFGFGRPQRPEPQRPEPQRGGPPPGFSAGPPPPNDRGPGGPGRGIWQMYVSPPGGALETLVKHSRWRNLALALTLLALIVATSLLLVRSARQAQQLAELQMNFVSGVSHELRTPLTVIRTAAFNLRGRVATNPDQVERYGKLIQEQSEKLGALVEQVLRYASSRVGQVIHEREAVVIDDVIEGGIRSSQLALDNSPYQLEKQIDPNLPLVLADERALQNVIQNLLDNAVKYGTESSNWIGLSVRQADEFLEIRIADRGPGIPPDEQPLIFEPFFRGRRALADQIHGTGLGLNLVKKIVEAHGGSIRVQSHNPQGAEFVVRVPVAPPEMQDEFAHSAG